MPSRSPSQRPGAARAARDDHPPADALVAIVKTRRDFERMRAEGWYRVPVASAPAVLREGCVRTLAFYLPQVFGDDAWRIRWTAPVLGMTTLTRRHLIPDELEHPRAEEPYLRLAVGPLSALPHPIPSRRLRRITFIPTTLTKLHLAAEINDLFHASPLEDLLWAALKTAHLDAEREYFVPGDLNRRYALDFALFCAQRNLDIECDGDMYHLDRASARYDNRRNNFLTARGWSVLRFTSAQLREEMPDVLYQVHVAVKDCGGLACAEPSAPPTVPPPSALALWQPVLWNDALVAGHSVDPKLPVRRPRRDRQSGARKRSPRTRAAPAAQGSLFGD